MFDRRNLLGIAATAALLPASLVPLFAAQDVPDRQSGTVAAVFAPTANAEDAFVAAVRAGSRVVAAGRWGNVIVVNDTRPGLAGRLRREGAWLVLSPDGLAGCLARPRPFGALTSRKAETTTTPGRKS